MAFKKEDVNDGALPNGNAAVFCRVCGLAYDKGCKPGAPNTVGQDDGGFKCDPCQSKDNAAELARLAPTQELTP
jgi:hypothetical protein